MITRVISDTTPIAMMTAGQLRDFLGLNVPSSGNGREQTEREQPQAKRYVYGLKGIKELFHVSHVTAQRYKNTFLAPAVTQQGRKIMVDAEKALQLFSENNQ